MTYKKEAATLAATGNELFDLSVPDTRDLYDEMRSSVNPKAFVRDTTSWDEITEGINAALAAHKGDGIVILSGAYAHMIGALVNLVRAGTVNIEYIPLGGMTISTRTPEPEGYLKKEDFVSEEKLRVQMCRALGVAKYLGFSDMEGMQDFIRNAPRKPTNPTITVVVPNETGLHDLYNSGTPKVAADAAIEKLTGIVKESEENPKFIFYSREGADSGGFLILRNMMSGKCEVQMAIPRFLVNMNREGVPVELGAFGHRDKMEYERSFGGGKRVNGSLYDLNDRLTDSLVNGPSGPSDLSRLAAQTFKNMVRNKL